MAAIPCLKEPLQSPISDVGTKSAILGSLWDIKTETLLLQGRTCSFEPYFKYYTHQCELALHGNGKYISARTHQDVANTVNWLKDGNVRDDIKNYLRDAEESNDHLQHTDEQLNNSIDLAARLLLMMEFGELQHGYIGRTQLAWTTDSLQDFVHEYYNTGPVLEKEHVKLKKSFNAYNLERIAGIRIIWTTNLADHLWIMDPEDKSVAIFYHATFLTVQKER